MTARAALSVKPCRFLAGPFVVKMATQNARQN